MNSEGWIKVYRQIQSNPLWLSEPFTRGQAWVDLLLLANHKPGFIYVRGNKLNVNRGQVGHSIVALALRWKFSRTKTKNFLNFLEKEQQISQQTNNKSSIITILNYESYQGKEQQTGLSKSSRKAAEKQQKSTNKNVKNVKNDKKLPPVGGSIKMLDKVDLVDGKEINAVIAVFHQLNRAIPFGRTEYRKSAAELIKIMGTEAVVEAATIAVQAGMSGDKYAPVITTPSQLQRKLGDLKVYIVKHLGNQQLTHLNLDQI